MLFDVSFNTRVLFAEKKQQQCSSKQQLQQLETITGFTAEAKFTQQSAHIAQCLNQQPNTRASSN
jgi:hypothetical protein